ncbi:MAG: Holliday junction resolvase RuvX [Candidatus Eremiobacteraeota bacterium]|nr:Holliday junction resolvase RuvX [Candidatus Eremiobacteraeota bacterium]
MTVIALDVGSKRIGIAISDPSEGFALPLTVVEHTNLRADIDAIVAVASEYSATEIVVGDPIRMTGERGIAADRIDHFVEALARRFSGTIHRVDERLTTAQATKTLIGADVSRAKRKTVVDKLAASLILEMFLSRRKARESAT